jgi:hypothetical protein
VPILVALCKSFFKVNKIVWLYHVKDSVTHVSKIHALVF